MSSSFGCRVQFSPWATLQTTVGVTVKGAEVKDVYGNAFPDYTNTSTIDHRCALHYSGRPLGMSCRHDYPPVVLFTVSPGYNHRFGCQKMYVYSEEWLYTV